MTDVRFLRIIQFGIELDVYLAVNLGSVLGLQETTAESLISDVYGLRRFHILLSRHISRRRCVLHVSVTLSFFDTHSTTCYLGVKRTSYLASTSSFHYIPFHLHRISYRLIRNSSQSRFPTASSYKAHFGR